jgi:hypothetical protein
MPMTAEGNRSKSKSLPSKKNPSKEVISMQARKIPQKVISMQAKKKKIPQKVISMQARKSLKRSNLNASKKNPSNWPSFSNREVTSRSGHATEGQSSGGTARAPRYPRGEAPGSVNPQKRRLQRQEWTGDEARKKK